MNTYVSNSEEAREYSNRYKFFYIILGFIFVIFTIRLWYLQIISGDELREFSEKNRIKQNKIQAPRGLILDREGQVLVENLPGFEAVLLPQYIKDLPGLAQVIGPILQTDPNKIISRVERSRKINGPFTQVRLKENLSREEVFRLKRLRLDIPGLEIRESIVRHYPLADFAAQLFGYVGEISKKQIPILNKRYQGEIRFQQGDIIGKSGLEETLEKFIRGEDGVSFIQVDAHGRETVTQTPNIYGEKIQDKPPQHGHNAILTIDRDIQEATYKAMLNLQRIGGIVAMKSNGEILAWVNAPSYDPNEFSTGISASTFSRLINDPFRPLRNKVIQDHAAPGSTFKPLIAAAALEEKIITDKTVVAAPGVFYFGRRPYHDSLKQGHGNVTVYEAIERSSNVFFYKMGISLGVDKMFNYVSLFGLGQKTGVDLQREIAGTLPNSEWKKNTIGEEWQPGENLSMAIGQGFVYATPLQMAVAYNTIATEGKVVQPFILKKIVDEEGQVLKENFPSVKADITQKQSNGYRISAQTFKVVKEGMRRVANGDRGTAKWWKIPGVEMAGKTGTAQVMTFSADQIYVKCESRPIHMRHHGWYIAWAPADKPEITVAALTEHSCHGSTGAAPIVRDVIQAYFKKYHPEVIEQGLQQKGKKASANTSEAPTPQEGD